MTSVTRDWKKIGNLFNRALLISVHLFKIIKESKNNNPSPENIKKYLWLEHRFYLDIYRPVRGYAAAFSKLYEIHDTTKKHIEEFEDNLLKHDDPIAYENMQKDLKFNLDFIAKEIEKEESKLQEYTERIYLQFLTAKEDFNRNIIKYHKGTYLFGPCSIINISKLADANIIDQELKRDFKKYIIKLAGVIDNIYRLLRHSEKIEEEILKEIKELYNKISEERTGIGSTSNIIDKLEEEYDRM